MSYRPKFDEKKAAELAAYFLNLSDGSMFILKLMKLLYIAEREAIKELGHPITYDSLVSMDNGPVLSQTLNLINGMNEHQGYWNAMIAPRSNYKVSITDDCEIDFESLSEAEMEIAVRVFNEYGHIPRFKLANLTHEFQEWKDPHGSSIPINYEELLSAVGYNNEDIDLVMSNLRSQEQATAMLVIE